MLGALAMLGAGLTGLTRPALGWDEHATWDISRRTTGQILAFAQHMDGVITPYYLFMHWWTGLFGDSLAALRTPSLIAVALGAGLAGELGRRLFGSATGLTAALILALVPQLARYSQEARAYGFAFLFAVLATLLLYATLERPARWRWLAYAAALTLLGCSHVFSMLVLCGHAVAVAVRWWASRDRRLLAGWLLAVLGAFTLASPLVYLGLHQRGQQLAWIGGWEPEQVLLAPGAVFAAPMAGLLIIGLGLAARWAPRPPLLGELAALAAVPPALLLGVSFVTSPVWTPRYVLFVTMPLALLAAVALRGRPGRTVAALALILAVGLPDHLEVRGTAAHGGMDFRAAAAVVRANQQPGDAVVFGRVGSWSLRAGFDYEFRNDTARPADVLLQVSAADNAQLGGVECANVDCYDNARVWYFSSRDEKQADPMHNALVMLRRKLERDYRQADIWLVPDGVVALYVRD